MFEVVRKRLDRLDQRTVETKIETVDAFDTDVSADGSLTLLDEGGITVMVCAPGTWMEVVRIETTGEETR